MRRRPDLRLYVVALIVLVLCAGCASHTMCGGEFSLEPEAPGVVTLKDGSTHFVCCTLAHRCREIGG